MLDDAADVKHVIKKTEKSMESLKCAWDTKELPLTTKLELCHAILMNLVFLGVQIGVVTKVIWL